MKIKLSNIHHNPHRNMDRNPVKPVQVQALIESFKRNQIWPNVVVRSKPGQRGHYELAYGHHRYAAMLETGLTAAEFIVQDLDEWSMYTAMVDENESQQVVTPELVYENIEAGVEFLEPVIRKCETLAEFRSMVPRGTVHGDDINEQQYSNVRNNVLSGEGLGVSFLARELPGGSSTRRDNIQTVCNAHYEETKAAAKAKRAEEMLKEAKATKKEADASDSPAKAAKLNIAAEKLSVKGKKLAGEAKKLRETSVSQDILLSFDSVKGMTEFAQTIKTYNIPKRRHKAAFDHLAKQHDGKGTPASQIKEDLNVWWFKDSGRAKAQIDKQIRDGWRKKYRDKALDEFAAELVVKMRDLTKEIKAVAEYASMIENTRVRENLSKQVKAQYDELVELANELDQDSATVNDVSVEMKALQVH